MIEAISELFLELSVFCRHFQFFLFFLICLKVDLKIHKNERDVPS